MKKFLVPAFFAIFFIFFLFFSFTAYQYYAVIHSDDPVKPYLIVDIGNVTVVRGDIAIDMIMGDRYNLSEKDIIISNKNSLAVITWPDKSQTRLGASSRMRIDRMQVARDYTSIEIEFSLEQGQVWSTVVRTIYPGSYFRTKLPDQGVIAGVRGTVYDIDLTRGYIRSVDHSVTLSDSSGKSISLLPGELVSVTNILRKLGKEVIDQTWDKMNQSRDTMFLDLHRASLQKSIDKISGQTSNLWDRFVRWILSFIPFFDDIILFESLFSEVQTFDDVHISEQQLLGLYQKLQDTKFVQERDKIRKYIMTQSDTINFSTGYLQVFARGAIWDELSFSGMTLQGSKNIVESYVKTFDTQLQSVIRVIPVGHLDTKSKETLRKLIQ